MKYVCIDDGAVTELISGREYQSIDFAEGAKLMNALSGEVTFLLHQNQITLFQDNEGAFLTTPGAWRRKKYVVIDCEQSALFTQLRSSESLSTFQKLLRFCMKYWSGQVLNKTEKLIPGTTKAILFPLPHSATAKFRVPIERQPLKSRLQKRGLDGQFLLVYKSGSQSADSSTEKADETNFRKVIGRLPDIYSKVLEAVREMEKSQLGQKTASTSLDTKPRSTRPLHLPFRSWLPILTEQQRNFVFASLSAPHRLLGPAGTGKTLALMLRGIRILFEAKSRETVCHALLVTHSEATREAISNALSVIDTRNYQVCKRKESNVSIAVDTLASLCGEYLQQSISESEFVDRDAQDSKILQSLYIEQAIARARREELSSFRPHLSKGMCSLFDSEEDSALVALLQHEISVVIKGRAGDSFDVYRNCPALKYGLPILNESDKGFVFRVFRMYQEQLEASNQFDTDDVVISALGQLDTPIWRRRRSREGYDWIGIDEIHLFNINELHVFHHFTRSVGVFPISFTVDQAQGVGDRGWNDEESLGGLLGGEDGQADTTKVTAVFRSSNEIRDFCHTILASGATLFTNFANTLSGSQSVFTVDDERRAQKVRYIDYANDDTMIVGAFQRAEVLRNDTLSSRPDVLITTLSETVLELLKTHAREANKAVTLLERRGDLLRVQVAETSGHFVLGHADFVGGLEFNAVVVVGVDRGRVPDESSSMNSNSRNYSSYAAHNRLYVASSRAKYGLNLLGVQSRGASGLLKAATLNGVIEGVS